MSKRYAARRDKNERAIIVALEAAGAAVQQLEPPLPDLLVSFRGELHLLEVKDHDDGRATRSPHRGRGNQLEGPLAALTPSQVVWWRRWKGRPAVIVHTADEAIAAIDPPPVDPPPVVVVATGAAAVEGCMRGCCAKAGSTEDEAIAAIGATGATGGDWREEWNRRRFRIEP